MVLIDNLTRSETFVYFTAYRGLGEFSRRYFRFMSWLVNEEVLQDLTLAAAGWL